MSIPVQSVNDNGENIEQTWITILVSMLLVYLLHIPRHLSVEMPHDHKDI